MTYHYSKEVDSVTDTLNRDFTGVSSGAGYSSWNNKTSNSNAVYAGNSAGGNDSIQLNNSSSNKGIFTTASGGNVVSITVSWNAATSEGNKLDIYGKNEAYTGVAQLYNAGTQGTKIGTITCGTNTSATITGSYQYIGLRSYSGGLWIDSITIEWSEATYAYSNTSIRFSSLISSSLWNRLNTESSIQGYGVMLSTPETLGVDPIEDWYGIADGDTYEEKIAYLAAGGVKNFYLPLTTKSPDLANAAQKAGAEGDHYIWYLNKVVLDTEEGLTAQQVKAKLTQRYTAVAYIRIADELVFLDQVTASAAGLADAAITGGQATASTANGSLKNLADMLA